MWLLLHSNHNYYTLTTTTTYLHDVKENFLYLASFYLLYRDNMQTLLDFYIKDKRLRNIPKGMIKLRSMSTSFSLLENSIIHSGKQRKRRSKARERENTNRWTKCETSGRWSSKRSSCDMWGTFWNHKDSTDVRISNSDKRFKQEKNFYATAHWLATEQKELILI